MAPGLIRVEEPHAHPRHDARRREDGAPRAEAERGIEPGSGSGENGEVLARGRVHEGGNLRRIGTRFLDADDVRMARQPGDRVHRQRESGHRRIVIKEYRDRHAVGDAV